MGSKEAGTSLSNISIRNENPSFLRVLVYGASTSIGTEIVRLLALFGHTIIAADVDGVRHLKGQNIVAHRLDLSDKQALQIAVKDVDAIVCAMYPARSNFAFGPTCRISNAVRILRDTGCRRLIVTSSAAMNDSRWLQNVLRWTDVDTHIDLARMETLLMEKKEQCDFTVLRLPMLTNDANKSFIVEEDNVKKGWFRIGAHDAAIVVVQALTEKKWIHRFPIPTYH